MKSVGTGNKRQIQNTRSPPDRRLRDPIGSMKKAPITDLDNTLFDWVDVWYNSFSAMLSKVLGISGVDEETLKAEIR